MLQAVLWQHMLYLTNNLINEVSCFKESILCVYNGNTLGGTINNQIYNYFFIKHLRYYSDF